MTKNENPSIKTAQFHYRCTAEKMEIIKKTVQSHNISMQEYFDYLIDKDISSTPMSTDLIQHQLNELKEVEKLTYLNTEILGMYFNNFLLSYYSRAEEFKIPEDKEKAFNKGLAILTDFINGIADKTEKGKNCSFLYGIFGNKLKKDKDFLSKLNSRLRSDSVFK